MKNIKSKDKIIINSYISAKDKNMDEAAARNIAINLLMFLEKNINKKEAIKYIDDLINNFFLKKSNCNFKEKCMSCSSYKKGCFENF
mgnify:CR=1 FL=1